MPLSKRRTMPAARNQGSRGPPRRPTLPRWGGTPRGADTGRTEEPWLGEHRAQVHQGTQHVARRSGAWRNPGPLAIDPGRVDARGVGSLNVLAERVANQ